jgi:transposase-like protein
MNDEIVLRKQAVELYLQDTPIVEIAFKLGKTRQWVYKWIDRYKVGDPDWFRSLSNAPKRPAKRISGKVEQTIITIRQNLKGQKYAQKGALINIKPPSIATINRVLKRNNLIGESDTKVLKKKEYPDFYCNVQQMDLIGPKYLKGGFRYYILNIIDIESHFAGVYPILDKTAESIVSSVCEYWMNFSMPDYLQMDNELSFRGSNRHPRSFGALIRLALAHNIVPIFIPPAEPWRNGVIEKFNDNVQKYFLKTQTFTCFEQLKERSCEFMTFHNLRHRYSTSGGKTPKQIIAESCYFKLKSKPDISQRIMLEEGEIKFIRFIRSDCIIRILDAKFELTRELMYSYVIARIVIKNHTLHIERDNIIHHIFPFLMPVDW